MPKKLILDTDPGVDDALALLYVLLHKDIELIGVTIVHGNSNDMQLMFDNACLLLEKAGRKDIPVYLGASKPLIREPGTGAHFVHGDDLLGNLSDERRTFEKRTVPDKHAVTFIVEKARELGDQLTIAAIGPLTNVALALRQDEKAMLSTAGLYMMGGAIAHRGNATPMAEANIHSDPHAAHIVLQSTHANKVLVPLNATHKQHCSGDYMKELAATGNLGELIDEISQFTLKFYLDLGYKALCHHDCGAVMAIVNEDVFVWREYMDVNVECTSKLCFGQTVADIRPSRKESKAKTRTKVMLDCDTSLFQQDIMAVFQNADANKK